MKEFPVGGSRSDVFDAMKSAGFTMSGWSDKWWSRPGGIEACVYGTGSRLLIRGAVSDDGPIADVLSRLESKGTETT